MTSEKTCKTCRHIDHCLLDDCNCVEKNYMFWGENCESLETKIETLQKQMEELQALYTSTRDMYCDADIENNQLQEKLDTAVEALKKSETILKYYDDSYKNHKWECNQDDVYGARPIDPEYYIHQELKEMVAALKAIGGK